MAGISISRLRQPDQVRKGNARPGRAGDAETWQTSEQGLPQSKGERQGEGDSLALSPPPHPGPLRPGAVWTRFDLRWLVWCWGRRGGAAWLEKRLSGHVRCHQRHIESWPPI